MASIIQAVNRLDDIWMDIRDKRVDGWFMMSSPWPSCLICLAYVVLVNVMPKWMEKREPFNIKYLMSFYNLFMVFFCGYTFTQFARGGWFVGYSLGCQSIDKSDSPVAMTMLEACYFFYISKFIELFDTLFFILRKKNNQVSFLHVVHHGIMPLSWWFGVRFMPGGSGTFHALFNSLIHICMYTYYGLAGLGPQFQKYLWWKKYMTKFQIIQFISVVVHCSYTLYHDCNFPKVFTYWILSYALFFLILFANFYRKAYQQSHAKRHQKHETNGVAVSNGYKKD